jgi:hypothetical protein
MEGRGHGDGKPGKTGRVLIEYLKEWTNSGLKKTGIFLESQTLSWEAGKKNNSVSSSLPAGKVPKNHSPIPVRVYPAEFNICILPASGTE